MRLGRKQQIVHDITTERTKQGVCQFDISDELWDLHKINVWHNPYTKVYKAALEKAKA